MSGVFFPFVFAQAGDFGGEDSIPVDGTTSNSSPTPVGGFTSFDSWCTQAGFAYARVCDASSCPASSPALVCTSSFGSASPLSCSVLASPTKWGWHPSMSAECCNTADACVTQSTVSGWMVGVESQSSISQLINLLPGDIRGHKLVRRSKTNWVVVAESSSDAWATATNDGGQTWSPPFTLKALVSQTNLPSGVSLSTVQVGQPALALNPSGGVDLAFEVRDTSMNPVTSAVYYARCTQTNCGSSPAWSSAISIMDPLLIETNPGQASSKWLYAFGNPVLSVDALNNVHVIFDDQLTNLVTRFPGVLDRFCDTSTTCSSSHSNWNSPAMGTNIAEQNNGYPRSPHVGAFDTDMIAVWLDNVSLGNSTPALYVSRFESGSQTWGVPFAIASGNFSLPFVSEGKGRMLVAVMENASIRVWECGGSCFADSSTPTAWTDDTSVFSPINALSSIQSFGVQVSPYDDAEAILLATGQLAGNRQLFGVFSSPSIASPSLNRLSNTGLSFSWYGFSDVSGASQLTVSPDTEALVQWLGGTSTSTNTFDSSIFSSLGIAPAVSLVTPSTPTTWQSVSQSAYSQSTSFFVSDGDDADDLYVSAYLSPAPQGTTYVLRENVDLGIVQAGNSLFTDTCTGSNGFFTTELCTIELPLFDPTTQLSVPDGVYYLTLVVRDSSGNSTLVSTPGQITLDVSQAGVIVQSPAPLAQWTGPSTRQFVLSVTNPRFAQSLSLSIAGQSGGNAPSLGTYPISLFGTTQAGCVKLGADYNCTFSFVPTSSIPEGVYVLTFSAMQDGWLGAVATVNQVTFDAVGPIITQSSPSGSISSPPAQVSFTLRDFSGIASQVVTINGNSVPAACTPNGQTSVCTAPFPGNISSGTVLVAVNALDVYGNSSNPSFSFSISSGPTVPPGGGNGGGGGGGGAGGGGGGGGGVIPSIDDLIDTDENGNVIVGGTPIVIPKVVVETVGGFSNQVYYSVNEIVDVTGPSAHAIFIGLCVLAGIASDMVFRRVFTRVRADIYKQRERLLRVFLAGLFFAVPLTVGWFFSLVAGFIFTVMEIVGFIAAAYLFKLLQYYDTFGYKPILSATGSEAGIPSSSKNDLSSLVERPPI